MLFHKDKGKGARQEQKGNLFQTGNGMNAEDPKKISFPGPGQYSTKQQLYERTTVSPRAPAYSLSTSG